MENNKTYNYGMLSVTKLIAAILVVMIHTMAFSSLSKDLWVATSLGICRVAVPFFFIISGYFFYNLKDNSERIKKIKKYTIFYGKAVLFEAVISIAYLIYLISNFPILSTIKGILFVGVTGSLWYISSMIIGFLFIIPFLKKDHYKLLVIISIIFFAFGLAGDSYYGIFSNTIIGTATDIYRNIFIMMQVGVTASVPFLTLGILLNKFDMVEKIKKPEIWIIIGGVLLLIEAFVLYKKEIALDYNLYISLLIVAPTIFIWTVKSKIKISEKSSILCRKLSVLVYITHQPIALLLGILIPYLIGNSVLRFLLTLILTVIFSYGLIKVKLDKFLAI